MNTLKPGRYQHFKGNYYELVGIAHHSETLEELVVYRALYVSKDFGPDSLWVRPRAMFEELVRDNGEEVPRFRYVGEVRSASD